MVLPVYVQSQNLNLKCSSIHSCIVEKSPPQEWKEKKKTNKLKIYFIARENKPHNNNNNNRNCSPIKTINVQISIIVYFSRLSLLYECVFEFVLLEIIAIVYAFVSLLNSFRLQHNKNVCVFFSQIFDSVRYAQTFRILYGDIWN